MQNVLVCDDDKEIVEAIDIYLKQEGINVFKAYNGLEALEIVQKNEIHAAIIDIMMPVMDGIQCTMKIREQSSIPIIILSAKSGSPNLLYEITTPGGAKYSPPSGRYWSCSKETFEAWDKDNRIWYGKDKNGSPRKKTFFRPSISTE